MQWTRKAYPTPSLVTTTDVTDRNGALQAIERCASELGRVQSVLVDGGYTGQPFADAVYERLNSPIRHAWRCCSEDFEQALRKSARVGRDRSRKRPLQSA